MQLYGRGLRRRLPPMLDGDAERIRMVYSLLFSLPGTPVLFYGEEIGMGENLAAEGRAAVRTPMQWSSGPNGGFSTAPPSTLAAPVVEGGYSPEHVNVSDQRRSSDSLLAFMTLLVRRYRECPELGWGSFEVLVQPHRAVLAARRTWDDASMVTLHNLGSEAVAVAVRLDDCPPGTRLVDLLRDGSAEVDEQGWAELELGRYGHRWLRVVAPGDRRLF
jgi:glycosidase